MDENRIYLMMKAVDVDDIQSVILTYHSDNPHGDNPQAEEEQIEIPITDADVK